MLVAKRNNTNTIGSRYSYLGLLKFLASMGIVIVHTLDQNANWGKLWYLVEFYFFITGFFTYRHFQQRRIPGKKTSIELKAKRAFAYSHKKFSYIFPYIIIGTFLKGITSAIASQGDGLKAMLFAFRSAPFDVFMLGSQAPNAAWAVWFVSAMFIMFPIFCIICQTKRTKLLIAIILPIISGYYSSLYGNNYFYLSSLIRTIIGLSVGILIYEATAYLSRANLNKLGILCLTLIECLFTIIAIICMYPSDLNPDAVYFRSLAILSFALVLIIFFSEKTFLSKINCRFMDYLEKVSLAIYLVHQSVITIVWWLGINAASKKGQLITVILSILVAMVTHTIVSHLIYKNESKIKRLFINTSQEL